MSEAREGLTLLQRFTLVRRLGAGGSGEVWLADDAETGSQLALKIFDGDAGTASQGRLEAETRKARALVHPNLLRVHDLYHHGQHCFVSMEFAAGGTLRDLRGASLERLLPRLSEVAEALDYAHRQGRVHRDLKPGNILLDDRGHCLLSSRMFPGLRSR